MSLFSKKPKSIADFEKEIEKLRQKKKLSARNSERLEEYEKQLSTLKTAEEAAQKKKARQKKIAIGSIAASLALVTCIIIAGCISESGTVESPAVSPGLPFRIPLTERQHHPTQAQTTHPPQKHLHRRQQAMQPLPLKKAILLFPLAMYLLIPVRHML